MPDVKRCPTCGAQNAAGAEWCTLCLSRFDGLAIPPPKPRSDDPVKPEVAEVGQELAALSADSPAPAPVAQLAKEEAMFAEASKAASVLAEQGISPHEDTEQAPEAEQEPEPKRSPEPIPRVGPVRRRAAPPPTADATALIAPPPPVSDVPVRFHRDGDRVRWVCPTCETPNDIDLPACRICGTVMARLFKPVEEPKKPKSPARKSLALSALLPGLGHAANGAGSAGMSRGVLYVWTLFIAILLLVRPPSSGRAMMRITGVVFALAAAGVWGISMVESKRLAEGEHTPVLPARAMTWISAGLTFALFVGLAAVVISRS